MKFRSPYRRRLGATALGATLIGLAGTAWAGHHEDRFPISIAEAQARAQARFQEADGNADGSITREEFDAVDWPDRGHGPDGHPKGPGMMLHRAGSDSPPDPAALDQKLFSAMDANADGNLSPAEFSVGKLHAARRELARGQIFEDLDDNGDGRLTADELPDPAGRLRSMDDDGDGVVTRAEARKHHRTFERTGGGAPAGADSDG